MPDGLSEPRQRRVLLTTDAVGGVWRYTLDLAAGLTARDVTPLVAVLGPAPNPAQLEEANRLGINLLDTGLSLDWTAGSATELADVRADLQSLARRARVTSVHLHAPSLAASGWSAPVVAVAHSCVGTWWRAVRGGPLPRELGWLTQDTAAGLRAADAVVAPSHAHAEAVRAAYGTVPMHVVLNGAAASPPPPAGGRPRVVLTAGRLWDDGKNAAALDRVAPLLDAPIRAAGPTRGPNGAAVDLPNLQLLGTLDAAGMQAAYAGAAVFASLASYEPFGLSVLEAANAGCRLVLSDIPTFRELWDGAAIFVRDEGELKACVERALDGEGDVRAHAARYTIDTMVDGTLAVHRAVGALV